MKIQILSLEAKSNKDCMGSFGLGFDLGRSLITRAIGWAKRRGVNIPDLQAAMLAAKLKKQGHDVTVGSVPARADAYYIHSSLNGCENEIEAALPLPRVHFFGAMAQSCRGMYEPYGEVIDARTDEFPAWELYDYRQFKYFPSLKKGPVVPVVTAFGCKYKCSYCPYASHYGPWSPRPIADVFSEIKRDIDEFGARGIIFRDPLFTADNDRTVELLNRLRVFRDLTWACETRIENVDAALLGLMKTTGCRAVHFGIESANNDVLHSVNRSAPSIQTMKYIINTCENLGIKTTCFFILGFPADTEETIKETIDLAINLNPNVAEFFVATPYPGTKLSKEIIQTKPHKDLTGYTLAFKHDNFTPERIDEIREMAYRRFYLRPRWAMKFLKML